jgi:hypothetical protein
LSEQKNDNYESLSYREKIIFLAGVFEGEGSMGNWSGGGYKDRYFRIVIKMTDLDIVERFKNFFKIGNIGFVKKYKGHHKQAFEWKVNGKQAIDVMLQLSPYLGIRRQEKFKICFQHYKLLHL